MKTTIRIPDALAQEAQARADWLGVSLNALVAIALDDYLGRERSRRVVPVRSSDEPGLPDVAEVKGSAASLLGLPGMTRQQRRLLEREAKKGGGS